MNIGNLIKEKLNNSSFENLKELYEAVYNIIGDECCAYNTFTEIINKNKKLQYPELLTISALLNIDLNQVAMHYISSKGFKLEQIHSTGLEPALEKDILCILNTKSKEKNSKCSFGPLSLSRLDEGVFLAISISEDHEEVLAYEFTVENFLVDFIFELNEICYFKHLKDILKFNKLTLNTFLEMNLHDVYSILKKESEVYYGLFPDLKPTIESLSRLEFKYTLIETIVNDYLLDNISSYQVDFSDNSIIYSHTYKPVTDYCIYTDLQDEILKKYNYNIPFIDAFKKDFIKCFKETLFYRIKNNL